MNIRLYFCRSHSSKQTAPSGIGRNLLSRDLSQKYGHLGGAVVHCVFTQSSTEQVVQAGIADMRPYCLVIPDTQVNGRRFHMEFVFLPAEQFPVCAFKALFQCCSVGEGAVGSALHEVFTDDL